MFEGKMPKRLPKGLEQAILSIQRLRGAQIIHKEFKRYFRGAQYRITMADRIGFYTIHCNLSIDANRKVAERVEFHHTNWRFLSEEIVNWDPFDILPTAKAGGFLRSLFPEKNSVKPYS